jgi:uncharacterized protein (TIGR03437 family)
LLPSLAIVSLLAPSAAAQHFEEYSSKFIGRVGQQTIHIEPKGFRIGEFGVQWYGAGGMELDGADSTGGFTRYAFGSEPGRWKRSAHYSRVSARNLYRAIDADYYFRQTGEVEFDLILHPGSAVRDVRMRGINGTIALNAADGSALFTAEGSVYRLPAPQAYQRRGEDREPVECRYRIDRKGALTLETGPYDRGRDLIVDPVISALTYLGGAGIDEIEAVGNDENGNILVTGITNSTNFPGGGTSAPSTESIFVTKLKSDGTSVVFTTLLGSLANANPQFSPQGVNAITSDSAGNVYVTGSTIAGNFPTTPGAWQGQPSAGGFLTKLSPNGSVIYSTFLGPSTFLLAARKVLVQNGVAYLAGPVSTPEFLGTAGALQRNVAGSSDLFALAVSPDGSAPLFLTAFGGSGAEGWSDMALDANGNIVLAGISYSPDLPLTADALPYAAMPTGGEAFLARIDPTGSRLVSSTFLGTSQISAIVSMPDGGITLAGPGTLAADFVAGSPHTVISQTNRTAHAYVARLPAGSNRPAWTTDLQDGPGFSGGISTDSQGNLYWTSYLGALSGGSPFFQTNPGIEKLAADGSRLLYEGTLPAQFMAGVSNSVGQYFVGGYTAATNLPVTPGAAQPSRDPGPPGTLQAPLNSNDGFAGVLDLTSFVSANFFSVPPTYGSTITWRIGEPAPAPLVYPIQLAGDPGTLSATPSTGLTANYTTAPAPAINIGADTTQTTAGTFTGSVQVASPSNPHASLALPVTLTILPQVSFDLAMTQVNIEYAHATQPAATTVAITPHFGTEYFAFTVTSSASWLHGYVDQSNPQQPVLQITTTDQVGTFDGTLTIGLSNLQNANKTLAVHLVVDPAGTIQLSATSVFLHVVKGQTAPSATINVTGSAPAVPWSLFVGVSETWLTVKQTALTTPGAIQIGVDAVAAPVGLYYITASVTPAGGQQILVGIEIEVSSGAPIDVTPSSISSSYLRFSNSVFNGPTLTIVGAVPGTKVQVTADQPWIQVPASVTTPAYVAWGLDTTLKEGTYQGNIHAVSGSTSVTVPVTWTIHDAPHLVFPTSPIGFTWTIGSPPPPALAFPITCPTILQEFVSVGATDFPSFLKVSSGAASAPASVVGATTPATISITADPTGLSAGTYKTNLSVQGSYPDSTVYPWIPVTFTVLPNPNAPIASVSKVVDAASYLAGTVAPGEIVVLFGSGLGPSPLATAQPLPGSGFPTSVAGWTVSFDGTPAPAIYASDGQTAVVVPFEVAGKNTTSVTVSAGGTVSVPLSVPVAATNPSGAGNAAAVNFNADGTTGINSASAPVARGDIVSLYVSGLGATTPVVADGSISAAPLPVLNAPVQVLVGGASANVLYAGPAPGLIAGLGQINVRIPTTIGAGAAPVIVVANGLPSQAGVTLSVR